jgi:hypothetical protein
MRCLTETWHLENLCLLLAYTVMCSYMIYSMYINNLFHLHKEVYVTQPEGFIDCDQPRHIFCLKHPAVQPNCGVMSNPTTV